MPRLPSTVSYMAFCPNCGSSVDGKFCAKCGASVGLGTDPPPSGSTFTTQTPSAGGTGLTDNVAAALCYIPIIGLIFLLIEPYNRNKLIRFHAFQSLFLLAAVIVLNIFLSVLATMMFSLYFLWSLIHLAEVVLWLFLIFKAFSGAKVLLPVIGPIAEKQA
jgi:uncharacterized membrane protein